MNGVNGDGAGGILWSNSDTRNGYDSNSLGSDESLGGALLTPIPWLRNGVSVGEDSSEDSGLLDSNASTSTDGLDDPLSLPITHADGDSLVPGRPDGAVTQGELIRLEQEAGVVPVTRNPPDTHVSGTLEENSLLDDEELVPHARGPDLLGSVDMGRVDGQDVEIRIGSLHDEDGKEKETDTTDAQPVVPDTSASLNTTMPTGLGSTLDAEDFEIVLKDAVEGGETDIMQLDEKKTQDPTSDEHDGDIVLVDVDGKTGDAVDKNAESSDQGSGDDTVT